MTRRGASILISTRFSIAFSDALMARVARRVHDKRVLGLIRAYLEAGVMADGLVHASEETPQGSPMTAPTQSQTSSSSDRFRGRGEGVGREAWYSSG